MSMNIAPQITQVVVNASAPATEALAKSNADRQVIPATVQTEAYVPQKSREQEARSPVNSEDPGTYEDIRNNNLNNRIISEDEQQSDQQDTDQQQQGSSSEDQQNSDDSSVTQAQDNSDTEQEQGEQEEGENSQQTQRQEAQEQRVIDQLKSRDREVRAHEQAHAAVGGSLAGSPSYEYQTGPDGKKYAVGGEVSIDVSKTNDPETTIRKMQTVRAAALAPAEPSSQDRKVAAEASRNIAEARAELINDSSNIQNPNETRNSSEVQNSNDIEEGEGTQQGLNTSASEVQDVSVPTVERQEAQHPSKRNLARDFISSDNDDKTAQVVSNRYASSFQRTESYFTAVA